MKHFLLKFNHGVEIGAIEAYIGHYKRTKDINILIIANEELEHKLQLCKILDFYDEKPSKIIDFIFKVIGFIIRQLCQLCPIFMLDYVAQIMELFAVVNYVKLSIIYPEFSDIFLKTAKAELTHKLYFKK